MKRHNAYSWMYVALVIGIYVASWFIPSGSALNGNVEVADRAKATLDILSEVGKFVLSLNSAMFAGASTLAIKGKDWSSRWGRFEGWCVIFALLSGALSYYAVYVGYVEILGMVYAGTIDPFGTRLRYALMLQYFGTLFGVFLIGLVFARMLDSHRSVEANGVPQTAAKGQS